MKYWTVHLQPENRPVAPVLVREGFSWGAFLLGPLWLLAHRAWIPAVLVIAAIVITAALAPDGVQPFLFAAISLADPGLAHVFGQLMEHGAEVLARMPPGHAAAVHDELTGAFRAVYAALAGVAAIATLLAWTLSMRRVT